MQRVKEFDSIRGLALLAIVIYHAFELARSLASAKASTAKAR